MAKKKKIKYQNNGGSNPPASHYKRLYSHDDKYIPNGLIDPNTGYKYFPEESPVPEDLWNTSRFLYQPFIAGEKQGVHNATYDESGEYKGVKELPTGFKVAKEDISNYYEKDLGQTKGEARSSIMSKMQDIRKMHRAQNKMGDYYFKEFQNPDHIFDETLGTGYQMDPNDEYYKEPLAKGEAKRAYTKFQKAWRGTSGKEARENSRNELEEARIRNEIYKKEEEEYDTGKNITNELNIYQNGGKLFDANIHQINPNLKKIPFDINYQQTGPQSATWQLPGPYASPERKSQAQFVRDEFNRIGTAKPYTVEYPEMTVYSNPEKIKKEQTKAASQFNKQITDIQKIIGYDNKEDVLSPQALADLRKAYSNKKVSYPKFNKYYENILKHYDPNVTNINSKDHEELKKIWYGDGRWMDNPLNVAKVAATVAKNAPLIAGGLSAIPSGILGKGVTNTLTKTSNALKTPAVIGGKTIPWLTADNLMWSYFGADALNATPSFLKNTVEGNWSEAGDSAARIAWGLAFNPMLKEVAPLYREGKNVIKNIPINTSIKKLKKSNRSPMAAVGDLGAYPINKLKYPSGHFTKQEIEFLKEKLTKNQISKGYKDAINQAENLSEVGTPKYLRRMLNPIIYGGGNKTIADRLAIPIIGIGAAPGSGFLLGNLLSDPYKNAINRKLNTNLYRTDIAQDPSSTASDTTININNNLVDFARVNEITKGETILGGEFINSNNNTVRTAKNWLTTKDKYYGDSQGILKGKKKIKDIQSFYGIENNKFKVGAASEFNANTVIVPNRYDDNRKIKKAKIVNENLRIVDKNNKPIYQNVPQKGKIILYSKTTKNPVFIQFETPEKGVEEINKYIKNNPNTMPIIVDNGRYMRRMHNKKGLTKQNFLNYYSQDQFREGNPGYNIVLKNKSANKQYGGNIFKYGGDVSTMGYRDDSPYNNASSLDIYSPTGIIDMGTPENGTGKDILANGQYLPAYSGKHQVPVGQDGIVKEVPLDKVDPNKILQYLINKGISKNHALGMVNNILYESGFNSGIPGDKGTSIGLFQHHAERKDALLKYIGGEENLSNWKKQIDYALTESDTQKYLEQDFKSPKEASMWFTLNWERPQDKEQKAIERLQGLKNYKDGRYVSNYKTYLTSPNKELSPQDVKEYYENSYESPIIIKETPKKIISSGLKDIYYKNIKDTNNEVMKKKQTNPNNILYWPPNQKKYGGNIHQMDPNMNYLTYDPNDSDVNTTLNNPWINPSTGYQSDAFSNDQLISDSQPTGDPRSLMSMQQMDMSSGGFDNLGYTDYVKMGAAVGNTIGQLTSDNSRSPEQKKQQDAQAITQGANTISGAIFPWLAAAYQGQDLATGLVVDQNIDPNTGVQYSTDKGWTKGFGKEAEAAFKPTHQRSIEKAAEGDTWGAVAEYLLPGIAPWIDNAQGEERIEENKRTGYGYGMAKWGGNIHQAYGGNMFPMGTQMSSNQMGDVPVTEFNTGGTHAENPYGGIPQGRGANGKVNLVEKGELKIPDPRDPSGKAQFVVSAQKDLIITKKIAEEFALPKKYIGHPVLYVANDILRKESRRENDSIENTSIQGIPGKNNGILHDFMAAHEALTEQKKIKENANFTKDLENIAQKYPTQFQELQQTSGQSNMPQQGPPPEEMGMMHQQGQRVPQQGMAPQGPPMMAKYGGYRQYLNGGNIHQINPNLNNSSIHFNTPEEYDRYADSLVNSIVGISGNTGYNLNASERAVLHERYKNEGLFDDIISQNKPITGGFGAGTLKDAGKGAATLVKNTGALQNAGDMMMPVSYQLGGGMPQQEGGQEIIQQVVQALQQGANPKEVATQLVQSGMAEEEAVQLVQGVMHRLQGGGQGQQMANGGNIHQIETNLNSIKTMVDNTALSPVTASNSNFTPEVLDIKEHSMFIPWNNSIRTNFENRIPTSVIRDNTNINTNIRQQPRFDYSNTFPGKFSSNYLSTKYGNVHQYDPNLWQAPVTTDPRLSHMQPWNSPDFVDNLYKSIDYVDVKTEGLQEEAQTKTQKKETEYSNAEERLGNPFAYKPFTKEQAIAFERYYDPVTSVMNRYASEVPEVKQKEREQSLLNFAGQLAPIAASFINMGDKNLKKEAKVRDPKRVKLERANYEQLLRDAGYSAAGARKAIKAGAGNAGTYLGNVLALKNREDLTKGRIHEGVREFNKGIAAQEASLNLNVDKINAENDWRRFMAAQGNAAQKRAYLSQAAGSLANLMQREEQTGITGDYIDATSEDFDYNYKSFLDRFGKK